MNYFQPHRNLSFHHFTTGGIASGGQAMVPLEYALGDVFRDGEEVVVIIRGEDGQLLQARCSWIFFQLERQDVFWNSGISKLTNLDFRILQG